MTKIILLKHTGNKFFFSKIPLHQYGLSKLLTYNVILSNNIFFYNYLKSWPDFNLQLHRSQNLYAISPTLLQEVDRCQHKTSQITKLVCHFFFYNCILLLDGCQLKTLQITKLVCHFFYSCILELDGCQLKTSQIT